MVAFKDLPTLICVTITAVNTVQRTRGKFKICENARVRTAATVTLKHSANCTLWSLSQARSHFHNIERRLMPRIALEPDCIISPVGHEPGIYRVTRFVSQDLPVCSTAGRMDCSDGQNQSAQRRRIDSNPAQTAVGRGTRSPELRREEGKSRDPRGKRKEGARHESFSLVHLVE
jgi:hypothetical protein